MATLNSQGGSPHTTLNSSNLTPMPIVPTLNPTWTGYIETTKDALLIFEAAIGGAPGLQRVVRRPHDRERSNLIKSGSVFVYEESASGIKRWTDGVPWSPSRIMGNFLLYRELEKPFPPGEKKRATKKTKREHRSSDPYPTPTTHRASVTDGMVSESPSQQSLGSTSITTSPLSAEQPFQSPMTPDERDRERQLVGSLTDSYQFKDDGLLKKTLSVKVDDISYHLVSYYTPKDVIRGVLKTPREDVRLSGVSIRPDLLHKQSFRSPLEGDTVDESIASQYPLPSPHGTGMGFYMPQPQQQFLTHHSSYGQTSYYNQPNLPSSVPAASPLSSGHQSVVQTPLVGTSSYPLQSYPQQQTQASYITSTSPNTVMSPQNGYYQSQFPAPGISRHQDGGHYSMTQPQPQTARQPAQAQHGQQDYRQQQMHGYNGQIPYNSYWGQHDQ